VSLSSAADVAPRREVHGPSALGGDWRRFVSLVWIIATTDFKLTYFGSVLGYLWSLMRPLMLFGVLYLVFSQIVKFGEAIPDYPMVLLFNIVLFTFFSEATQNCVTAVINRESLVRKMHFPRLVIPLATVLTAAFNLAVNLLAVFVFLLAYGIQPRASWLLLPFVLLGLVALATGIGMALSVLYVRYRDVQPIWTVASTILFYGSPVLYTIESVPEKVRAEFLLNPIASLLELGRVLVIDPSAPSLTEAAGGSAAWIGSFGLLAALCGVGFWLFNREAPRVAEQL
jgi:ABC-2 type transport system permease protein